MSWLKAWALANTARVKEREREREEGCGEKERYRLETKEKRCGVIDWAHTHCSSWS
jgi:hypothetical protein